MEEHTVDDRAVDGGGVDGADEDETALHFEDVLFSTPHNSLWMEGWIWNCLSEGFLPIEDSLSSHSFMQSITLIKGLCIKYGIDNFYGQNGGVGMDMNWDIEGRNIMHWNLGAVRRIAFEACNVARHTFETFHCLQGKPLRMLTEYVSHIDRRTTSGVWDIQNVYAELINRVEQWAEGHDEMLLHIKDDLVKMTGELDMGDLVCSAGQVATAQEESGIEINFRGVSFGFTRGSSNCDSIRNQEMAFSVGTALIYTMRLIRTAVNVFYHTTVTPTTLDVPNNEQRFTCMRYELATMWMVRDRWRSDSGLTRLIMLDRAANERRIIAILMGVSGPSRLNEESFLRLINLDTAKLIILALVGTFSGTGYKGEDVHVDKSGEKEPDAVEPDAVEPDAVEPGCWPCTTTHCKGGHDLIAAWLTSGPYIHPDASNLVNWEWDEDA
jgi:hypothetical protein